MNYVVLDTFFIVLHCLHLYTYFKFELQNRDNYILLYCNKLSYGISMHIDPSWMTFDDILTTLNQSIKSL